MQVAGGEGSWEMETRSMRIRRGRLSKGGDEQEELINVGMEGELE
jgi:hypothetical protein